jgi:hypothetical protein
MEHRTCPTCKRMIYVEVEKHLVLCDSPAVRGYIKTLSESLRGSSNDTVAKN